MKLSREVGLFFIGGTIGFIVDAGGVQLLVSLLHWNPYGARVISFLCAATATWLWNRRTTFADRPSGRSLVSEWVHWLGLMSIGWSINYAVFALLLWQVPRLHPWPIIPTAAGSAVAALVNFLTARLALFNKRRTAS